MAKLFVVRVGAMWFVKAYQRTKAGKVPQYATTELTEFRSEALQMSWNQARSVANRSKGSISAA